jgi:hypothetical protein
MSSTDELRETGRKVPGLRPRATRRSREPRNGFWRVFIVSAFFVAVLAANLFVGAVVVVGNVRSQTQSSVPGATGPTALITHPLLDGTFCRYSVFDNNSARTLEDKIELCGTRGRAPSGTGKSDFSWGGR